MSDFFQVVGTNYVVSLTDPLTFTQYAPSNAYVWQISITEVETGTVQVIDINVLNPCFASAFDPATVFNSPPLPSEITVYLEDSTPPMETVGDYTTFEDTTSQTKAPADGVTFCGPRNF